MNTGLIAFLGGFGVALIAGAATRILIGMRLNLYFIHREPGTHTSPEASLIPITEPHRKVSLSKTLLQGRWRENQELILGDYSNHAFPFRVGFHLWYRYYLVLLAPNLPDSPGAKPSVKLDNKYLRPGRRYPLRTGMRLSTGDREFTVYVSPVSQDTRFARDLSKAA